MTDRPSTNDVRDWFRALSKADRSKCVRFVELTADAALSKIGIKSLAALPAQRWLQAWGLIEAYCTFWDDEPQERFRELKGLKALIESENKGERT